MPLFDKPDWIQHGGAAILGLDIDASSERLATGGADSKIRIWAMRPVLLEGAELDAAVPKLLATLSDSVAPVNCVRFAPAARLLAAGTDSADGMVYELREGRGAAAFGSLEAPSLENWRLRCRLRGHETNVTDVAWAPDSRRLASGSVDNKVKIWDTTNGHCIRTLEGHAGWVKGVAWDPFDIFLASQGDREVLVWRLEDGSLVARITELFASAPIVSFALRPAWSPDGQTLAAPNGYDNGMHVVPLLIRNTWVTNGFSLVGHKGTVTVARYNPHLYTQHKGAGASDGDEDAGSIVALGSTDKTFSVWHPSVERPLLVGKGCFDSMVNDLAWAADGRVLAAASQDGSVFVVVFDEGELGRRVPDADVQTLLAQLYGDPALRTKKMALPAAPELLELEARARAEVQREERLINRMGSGAAGAAAGVRPSAPVTTTAGPAAAVAARASPSLANGVAAAAAVPAVAAPSGPPPRPPQPTGTTGALPVLPGGAPSALTSSPARAAVTGGRVSGKDPDQPPQKRIALQPLGPPGQVPSVSGATGVVGMRPVAGGGAGADVPSDRGAAPGAAPAPSAAPKALVPVTPVQSSVKVLVSVERNVVGEQTVELQALNTRRDAQQRPIAEVVCLVGQRRQWRDCLQGQVVAMAGSSRLVVVSTSEGDLMVYSAAGRRLFPPIRLGSPASRLFVSPGAAITMALLADGQLCLWDFAAGEAVVETSVVPLLAAQGPGGAPETVSVNTARLISAGWPLVTLSNGYAYVYNVALRCWMRVADDAFPANATTTGLPSGITTYTYFIRPYHEPVHEGVQQMVIGTSQQHSDSFTKVTAGDQTMSEKSNSSEGAIHSYEVRLVLEFCDKGSLKDALDQHAFMQGGSFNLAAMLETAADVAKAMVHMHAANVLHSDLKARNIMLKSSGMEGRGVVAKVADFGLSTRMEGQETHLSSCFQGTLTHMAPEVMLEGRISKAADVYSFGILMWELFCGGDPFAGVPRAHMGHAITKENRRPKFPPFAPRDYVALASRCWDPDMALRPTFEEVLVELGRMREELAGDTPPLVITPPRPSSPPQTGDGTARGVPGALRIAQEGSGSGAGMLHGNSMNTGGASNGGSVNGGVYNGMVARDNPLALYHAGIVVGGSSMGDSSASTRAAHSSLAQRAIMKSSLAQRHLRKMGIRIGGGSGSGLAPTLSNVEETEEAEAKNSEVQEAEGRETAQEETEQTKVEAR